MAITVTELESFDRAAWNRRVESVPEGTIAQTTHIEGFHLVTGGGSRPRYLVAQDEGGQVVGQLVLLEGFFAAPEVVARPWLRGFIPLCDWALRTYTWMQGPLVFEKGAFAEILTALLGHVDARAARGAYMVRRASLPAYEDGELRERGREVVARFGFAPQAEATFHLDLRKTPEELWKDLKSSARKNLRKLLDDVDLVVAEMDAPEEVRCYWEMLVETQRRHQRFVSYRTLEEFEAKFWAEPHRQGVLRGVVVRTREGQAVAGLLFRGYNRWIQELGVAYTDYSLQHKIYGQDLIKWHIMRWGHARDYRIYDLMGVEVDSADPKKRAIFQFKEKWGGKLVEGHTYTKVYSPWRDAVLHLGMRLSRRRRHSAAGKR